MNAKKHELVAKNDATSVVLASLELILEKDLSLISLQEDLDTHKITSIHEKTNIIIGTFNGAMLLSTDFVILKEEFANNSAVTFHTHHLIKESGHFREFLSTNAYLATLHDCSNCILIIDNLQE